MFFLIILDAPAGVRITWYCTCMHSICSQSTAAVDTDCLLQINGRVLLEKHNPPRGSDRSPYIMLLHFSQVVFPRKKRRLSRFRVRMCGQQQQQSCATNIVSSIIFSGSCERHALEMHCCCWPTSSLQGIAGDGENRAIRSLMRHPLLLATKSYHRVVSESSKGRYV